MFTVAGASHWPSRRGTRLVALAWGACVAVAGGCRACRPSTRGLGWCSAARSSARGPRSARSPPPAGSRCRCCSPRRWACSAVRPRAWGWWSCAVPASWPWCWPSASGRAPVACWPGRSRRWPSWPARRGCGSCGRETSSRSWWRSCRGRPSCTCAPATRRSRSARWPAWAARRRGSWLGDTPRTCGASSGARGRSPLACRPWSPYGCARLDWLGRPVARPARRAADEFQRHRERHGPQPRSWSKCARCGSSSGRLAIDLVTRTGR
jgi:hypothetical protein